MPPGWGKPTVIRIAVDGGDVVVNAALQKVRAAVKKSDVVRIENRRIVIELHDRYADEAASKIAHRLRERLADYHVDIDIDD